METSETPQSTEQPSTTESLSESVKREIGETFGNTKVGSPEFAAFSDVAEFHTASGHLTTRRNEVKKLLKEKQQGNPLVTDEALVDAESELRITEYKFASIESQIDRSSSRLPGYSQAYDKAYGLHERLARGYIEKYKNQTPEVNKFSATRYFLQFRNAISNSPANAPASAK